MRSTGVAVRRPLQPALFWHHRQLRRGKGLVVATGGETELGHINQMMSDIEKHRTPLMVQMDKLGKTILSPFW